ncbi:MAG: aspartate dehydrogenase domain-containing protein [Gemmobacter sp.]
MTPVNLIGTGRIGAAVAAWLRASDRYRLRAVITRGSAGWSAAPLTIDAAGPAALRAHGPALLAQGELWTVGAAALIDDAFRAALERAAQGRALRLFTPWIAGPAILPAGTPATLHITQSAPRLGPAPGTLFDGPLAAAARAFPDHLNTATAAALTGPGIDATRITLVSTPDGGPHVIRARFAMPGQAIETEARFDMTGPHPVAAAIIAALEARGRWLRYG